MLKQKKSSSQTVSALSSLNFSLVTDIYRKTESDALVSTMQFAQVGSKILTLPKYHHLVTLLTLTVLAL